MTPADVEYLAHIDAQVAHHEALAARYRDIAALIRGLSDAPDPPSGFVPFERPRPGPRPSAPKPSRDEDVDNVPADYLDDDATVFEILKAAKKRLRRGIIAHSCGFSEYRLSRTLKRLVAQSRILKHGELAGTEYEVPATVRDPDPAPDPEDDEAEPEAEPEAEATESRLSKLAFELLQNVLTRSPQHVGDIVLTLSERMASVVPYNDVLKTLKALHAEGAVVEIPKGHEVYYAKRADTDARKVLKRRIMEERFDGPGSNTLGYLKDFVRLVPDAVPADLLAVLAELVQERAITVRTVGDERHYARKLP